MFDRSTIQRRDSEPDIPMLNRELLNEWANCPCRAMPYFKMISPSEVTGKLNELSVSAVRRRRAERSRWCAYQRTFVVEQEGVRTNHEVFLVHDAAASS